MPAFSYRAIDAGGKRQKGVIEADSAKAARMQLRDRGLLPDSVEQLEENKASAHPGRVSCRKRRLTNTDLGIVTQQLSTLLGAGLSIEQSLSALIEQVSNESLREVLAGVRAGVNEGETLARALERYSDVFNPLYRALVEAGEMSGELPMVIERLAEYSENSEALRQKTLLAFLYPAIVTLVAILVIGGLVAYVVPQVIQVFQQSKQTLPLLTRLMIVVSDLVRGYWWLLLAAAVASVFSFRVAMRREAVVLRVHRALLRMPGIGYLVRGVDSARLANTLSILIGSGVPMMAALKAGTAVMGNHCLRQSLEEASLRVREGMSLSRALARDKLFPPILIHLIASGEASGRLGSMLERAARQQEREMQHRIALLTGMLEPLLIVVMGGIVMLVVLAILLPIIDLNQFLVAGQK